jgi:ABC-2 type transport system ATP-binding protein
VLSADRKANGADGWSEWTVRLAPGVAAGDVLEICTAQGFPLRNFETHKPSLHDVFIHLVGGELEEAA